MAKLVGYQKVHFTATDGNVVNGYSLYFALPVDSRFGEGFSFDVSKGKKASCFVPESEFQKLGLKVGVDYNYSFNRFGSIDRSTIVKA